ncbi:hypothetical protein GQ55_1G416600 [Panicum hallii var. hallii]|uniref:Uncharacterized protein n=1 Tax=Panicum hallii var. hallii TaxID=1504633 RepID=A0A2T7FD20_9POAL|nr:hypothetical protein GQ55_1G416600 [Panicum hallii var. hallii]
MPYDQTKGFCCRVSWPIFLALRRPEGILPIPPVPETAPPLLPLSSPHQPIPTPPPSSPAPPHHTTGEGDSFLAAAARPDPDRHAFSRRGACAVSADPAGLSVGAHLVAGYLARLGLGGPLLPSYHASRLRARVIVSRSPVATVCFPRELPRATEGPLPPLRPPEDYPTEQLSWRSMPKESFEVWKFLLKST